jgi:hypothetical protein
MSSLRSTPMTRPRVADHLRGDEADLAAAGAQVEHRLPGGEVRAGVTAAVVPVEHVGGDRLEVAGVVVDGAAQLGLHGTGTGAVAGRDGGLDLDRTGRLRHGGSSGRSRGLS